MRLSATNITNNIGVIRGATGPFVLSLFSFKLRKPVFQNRLARLFH